MIKPFPFQTSLRNYFKEQSKTWNWFLDKNVKKEQIENFKTDLLKNAYRIDLETEPELYETLELAKTRLGIIIPVTIYQSQYIDSNNGTIVIFEDEAHLILSGTVLKLLTKDEQLAFLGHEIAHILLNLYENGDYEVTSRIINAIANEGNSELYYSETSRLFQLFTELFCDIGSWKVCGSLDTTINMLVKMHTGLEKVSAESYLKQADEIIARIDEGSSGDTHPEIYIRAKALKIYSEDAENKIETIEKMVKGRDDLHLLNLFNKNEVYHNTKYLVDLITKAKWTQSEHTIVLYKHYFKEYNANKDAIIDNNFRDKISRCKDNLKNYYCYVMLDFALCDTDIKDPYIGSILDVSEQLGLEENMKSILKKELKLTEKSYKEMANKSIESLNQLLQSDQESAY